MAATRTTNGWCGHDAHAEPPSLSLRRSHSSTITPTGRLPRYREAGLGRAVGHALGELPTHAGPVGTRARPRPRRPPTASRSGTGLASRLTQVDGPRWMTRLVFDRAGAGFHAGVGVPGDVGRFSRDLNIMAAAPVAWSGRGGGQAVVRFALRPESGFEIYGLSLQPEAGDA